MQQHGLSQLHQDMGEAPMFWPAVALILSIAFLWVYGYMLESDERAEREAAYAAQRQADEEALREARRLRAMQAMCGGENAVAVDLGNGWHQCKTKRNANTVKVKTP